ncbi:MAG: hypothetical protein NT157_04550 [Candidatus Micrarchaeota archaeon]|nr:hypothetical protein [Candidatus Micrarchaeota archaeon]
MTKKETISIRMSEGLWKKVKLFAIERDMKISDFVETALIHAMKETNGA